MDISVCHNIVYAFLIAYCAIIYTCLQSKAMATVHAHFDSSMNLICQVY